MAINSFPPSSGITATYKQLKLNKVTSPKCTVSNQLVGALLNYNSEYYLIVSNATVWKIRRSDRVVVGSANFPQAIFGKPVVVNDFIFATNSAAYIGVIDLVNMTSKYFTVPTTSAGAINAVIGARIDVRYVSGSDYQVLLLASGVTAVGVIVCTLTTTAVSGAIMPQVSFKAQSAQTNAQLCFGVGADLHYYIASGSVTSQSIYKVLISTGATVGNSITPTFNQAMNLADLRNFTTTDYILVMQMNRNVYESNDVYAIKKSDMTYQLLGITTDNNIMSDAYQPMENIANKEYAVFSDAVNIYIFKNDGTYETISKSEDVLNIEGGYMARFTGTILPKKGYVSEAPLAYDAVNKKISMSKGAYFDGIGNVNTLTTNPTFDIREYDIV